MRKRLFVRFTLTALLSLGLYAVAAPAAFAAPAAGAATVTRQSGETAEAAFLYQQGDTSSFVQVFAAPKGLMTSTGPLAGPGVSVSISESSPTTCASFAGVASVPALRFTDLTSVTFPEVTMEVVPVGDPECPANGQPFFVTVALTWAGVGNITTQHAVEHIQISPTAKATIVFQGRTRNATVSGFVSYPSPLFGSLTLTAANSISKGLNAGHVVTILIEH